MHLLQEKVSPTSKLRSSLTELTNLVRALRGLAQWSGRNTGGPTTYALLIHLQDKH